METKSINNKTIQLTENGKLIGELIYETIFLSKAQIKFPNSDSYQINPIGIFRSTTVVTKNEIVIANLKMNWRGQILFSFKDGQEYILKGIGPFYSKYNIESKDHQKLIELEPKFNWKKMAYNYTITYPKKPDDILLILLAVYACNYTISSMAGVM